MTNLLLGIAKISLKNLSVLDLSRKNLRGSKMPPPLPLRDNRVTMLQGGKQAEKGNGCIETPQG